MKKIPIPNGTLLKFRNYKATVIECLNTKKRGSQEYRYYVDTDGQRWSLSESDLREYNKRNPLFLTSGYPGVNLK